MVRARAAQAQAPLAQRADGVAGNSIACARSSADHAVHHRSSRRPPHRIHADRAWNRSGDLCRVLCRADLDPTVSGSAHRHAHRRGSGRVGVQAPRRVAAAVFRAPAHRCHCRSSARHRADPRLPCFGGNLARPRPAIPFNLPGADVLLLGAADVNRAGGSGRDRPRQPRRVARLSDALELRVPARGTQSGIRDRIRCRDRDRQEPSNGARSAASLRRLPGLASARRLHDPAGGQHL